MDNASLRRFPIAARCVVACAWLWFCFVLGYLTDTACPFLVDAALLLAGLLIGSAWVMVTVGFPELLGKPWLVVWLTVPLVGLLGIVCATDLGLRTNLGLRTRVTLSEWALADEVDRLRLNHAPVSEERIVGLFRVHESQTFHRSVYLFTSQSFINHHGIAHIPTGDPIAPRMSVRHLFDQWYVFEWRF